MQRQYSAFGPSNEDLEFDFDGNIESSLLHEDPFRMRLDSEYVWEAGDDMYDDIVASTHPTVYHQPLQRKNIDYNYNYQQHTIPPCLEELNSELYHREQIQIPQPRYQQDDQSDCQGCRRNQENEEDHGCDSTFVSCLFDMNQSSNNLNFDYDEDMQDAELFQTFYQGSNQNSNQKMVTQNIFDHSSYEDSN